MTCAIYARVSTKDKGQDTENQLRDLRHWADALGHDPVEYVDHVSGSGKKTRPAFDRMMDDARTKRIGMVLFWSLDRFSREGAAATLGHLQKLDSYGCGWRSYTEQYLDSTGIFREAVIAIMATLAKQERVRISERVTAGMATARAKGIHCGRRPIAYRPERMRELRASGLSIRQISAQTGMSHAVVQRAVKALEGTK